MRAAGLGVLIVLAVPAVALAGTAADRARELAAAGKLDEAEKVLDEAIPALQGKERTDARRLRADITGRRPERAAYEKACALYQELAREDEADTESRWALYELLWERGERLVAASRKIEEPAALLKEAKETF